MTSPPSGRRDRKRQATLDLLAQTAFDLFEQQGYDAVTMEQIAQAADVAKGTLYNHFPVKEALLRHQFHRELAEQWPALRQTMAAESNAIARLRLFFWAAADWAQAHQRYLPHYLRHRLGQAFQTDAAERSGTEPIFQHLLADAQAAGHIRGDLDVVRLAGYLQFQYLAALMRWLAMPDTRIEDELAAMLDLFLRGAGMQTSHAHVAHNPP